MTENPDPPVAAPPQPAALEGGEQIRKRSVKIAGHSTSLSLEGIFWDALKEVAAGRALSLNALIEEIDRGRGSNLSSAVRVYLLKHYRAAARMHSGTPDNRAPEPTPQAPSEDPSRLP